jgi:hypothetical protein
MGPSANCPMRMEIADESCARVNCSYGAVASKEPRLVVVESIEILHRGG